MKSDIQKVFFCYERDFAMRWTPVVFHGEVPKPKKEDVGNRSHVWPLEDDDFIGAEPAFGRLQAKHPAPKG